MKELKIHTFDEIAEEKIKWLWKPYIAFGKITVIQGDPGNGKTTLALAIASLISKREKMPTGNGEPFLGNILYQSGEDSPGDTIKPRLIVCGADCSRIAFVEPDGKLSPQILEEAIKGTNAKLVVLDPLQAFLTEKQNISSAKNMRPILRDLGNVASRTGAAIIIVGHMNKGEKSKGIYRGLGSIDITAAARSVLLVGKRKDDPDTRFMTQIKNNLGAFGKTVSFTIEGNGRVEFLGECDIAEEDLLSTTIHKQSKFEIAKQLISSMLAEGDKKSNEIYDACLNAGVSGGTIQLAKKKLKVKSVHKIDDWYWTLSSIAQDSDNDKSLDTEPDMDIDETPVTFLNNINDIKNIDDIKHLPLTKIQNPNFKPGSVTMPSPFGELTLIDWRACV